jgi:4-hydroxy-2-oxoheptanedioate aldolase
MRHDEHRAWADEHVTVIPMIETAEALANLDDILTVPGIDAIYVGPADLAISLGLEPYGNDGNPIFDDALAAIVDGCVRHGVVPGIHANGSLTPKRRAQGFRMITIASDGLAMQAGYAAELAAAKETDTAEGSGALY